MNELLPINRRDAIRRLTAWTAGATLPVGHALASDQQPIASGLGVVIYDCGHRREWMRQQDPTFDLFEPINFLNHCRSLGAGGMQAKLGILEPKAAGRLRDLARQHALFIEGIIDPPDRDADRDRFEAEIKTAAAVGARAVRTVIMPGRRYERFGTLSEFREYERRARQMVERAAPIVEKHRVPLAIENHKDQRDEARVALLKSIDCEFVGACIDTGNSLALLEDPIATVEAFAPWAKSVHLKDQALRESKDGFLLGDIPLGQGCFDLSRMVAILRKAQPQIRFVLEIITRDPLSVPCLTERYWATMPTVPGSDLARTLRMVRQHASEPLPSVSERALNARVELEDFNVTASLKYARDRLKL